MGQFRANSAKCDSGRALRGEEHKEPQWNVDSMVPSFLSSSRFEAQHPRDSYDVALSSRPLQ